MTIHVAHVLYRFAVGGLENGLVNLINGLGAAGYRHSIICLDDYDKAFLGRIKLDNVSIFALRKKPGSDPATWYGGFRLLRKLDPDILHTRNIAAMEMQLAGMMLRIPKRIHGEHGWDVNDLHGSNERYRRIRKLLAYGVHEIVALSEDIENYLVSRVGIPSSKVHRLCNGVDTNRFVPPEAPRSDVVTIGTVGRMKAVKNQVALVEAYATMVQRRPDFRANTRLVMIGDGPLRQDCQDFAEKAGIAPLVECPGESENIADVMRTMNVFALPSLGEGISNTILEAMASGLPVVATNVGGNSELVDAGKTGELVPSGDIGTLSRALEAYVESESLRTSHGQAGRKRAVEEFSLAGMINRYAGLYGGAAATH